MKDNAENIRQSDVTAWGAAALLCGAIALLSANLGVMLPANLMMGLHATRIQGGSLNQLRAEVVDLRNEATRIRSENSRMSGVVSLVEQDKGDLVRRVGFIEASIPALIDTGSRSASIDASLTTAAIGESSETETIEADGGTVVISRQPMTRTAPASPQIQDRPKALNNSAPALKAEPMQDKTGPASAFGLALGDRIVLADAVLNWKDISRKAGPLLLGLSPVLSGTAGAEEMQLVAGPISSYAEAEQICGRMLRIGVRCLPVPYMGNALPE